MSDDLARRRIQYETAGLDAAEVAADPVEQWRRWYDEAVEAGLTEPNAMTVSTVDESGNPDSRVVLARGFDQDGLVFYTNFESTKSRQIGAHPDVAINFAWLGLHRQVRITGRAERLDDAASDAYFAQRPRASQIGAWASPQSRPLDDRATLDQRVAETIRRFDGAPVPRPPFWGGWIVVPSRFEFWQGRPDRLHDRIAYDAQPAGWRRQRLAP